LDTQYRYKVTKQKGASSRIRTSNASTLKTDFGYKTAEFKNINAVLEIQNITGIGKKRYNDKVSNDKSEYAVIADSQSTKIGQSFL